jgi:hypothetical protein
MLLRCLILVSLTITLPRLASAQYVFYHAAHGDWTVTCTKDMVSGQTGCRLGAPPPTMASTSPVLRLTLTPPPEEAPAVAFEVSGAADPGRPVRASVDTTSFIEAKPDRAGAGGWTGAQAEALLNAMQKGEKLTLSWWAEAGADVEVATINLAGLKEAIADYRQKRAAYGGARQARN